MEPKSPDQLPTPIEYMPTPVNPEQLPASPEWQELSPERGQERQQQVMPAATPAPVQLPTPVAAPQPITDDAVVTPVSDDHPAVAADEDLIEKEWVDKAKRIVSETQGNPHQQEREVGRLQADYLKKRYGKDLGEA